LCFHGIGTPGRPLEQMEDEYWVAKAQFDEMLDVIRRHPAIRITFDDGNASDAAAAMPALIERGLTASFFVVAGRLDEPGSLSSADVRELVSSGMTIGLHGMRHRPWRFLDDSELEIELSDAAKMIAAAAGQPLREAACPFGAYDRTVLRAIRARGFARVYTVDGGAARRDSWLQARYTIRRHDTPADIERMARSPRGEIPTAVLRAGKSLIKRLR
jgi:peptidoglycan/xylan/chitin deacetylase (PgdA/CDA1 family)